MEVPTHRYRLEVPHDDGSSTVYIVQFPCTSSRVLVYPPDSLDGPFRPLADTTDSRYLRMLEWHNS